MKFIKLTLEIDSIIIGERIKGGVFRPCQTTIPSSTIEGALKHHLGLDIKAVGYFVENTYKIQEFTYSIRDKMLQTAKMPIFANYLAPRKRAENPENYKQFSNDKILADIFVVKDNTFSIDLFNGLTFRMGALKSKGFGKCKVIGIKEEEYKIVQGLLKVKLFEDEAESFNITAISPIYSFLFRPDKYSIGGKYKRALFPDSLVNAPKILLKEETYYDEQNG
jgi:hypothetical protein